ncbi:MAG: PSD1 and planctomycete cytochrome C domain-containing protein [Gemmataceae bacterium]|nr:PSD1 and planctomycete cytochrome C domain-containing protein [Gemmataceae bacterium]
MPVPPLARPMTGLLSLVALSAAAPPDDDRFFETSVRPVLVERCVSCHGDKKRKGGLRLDTRAGVLAGGDGGPVAVAGKPADSPLVKAVRYGGDIKMPPDGKLPDAEVAALEQWVGLGMPWPADRPAAAGKAAGPAKELWSLKPVVDPPVPRVLSTEHSVRNDIDRFVLAKLLVKGLKPAPPADRRTLVRRATFDLTGLPPTPEEVEAFVADPSPDSYPKLVDRLLASPAYGERWGRHWLDLARYCDSFDARITGTSDMDCLDAWRYRDWVVRAFNADLPYDRFVRMQIAGDILPLPDQDRPDGIVATGFLALGNWGGGDADKEKLLTDIADDQVDVVGRSILGLTLACARCHDHKFDPVSTKDYYALAGVFFSTHILPNVGPKTNGPPMLRIPLGPPPPPTAKAVVLAKRADNAAGKPGLVSWRGGPDCPNCVANTADAEAAFLTIRMPARTVAVHPGPGSDVAVVWTAPAAGAVRLSGKLTDYDPNCGDGITWELRHVTAKGEVKTIASGVVGNGQSGAVGDQTAGVAAGDRLELMVKRQAGYECDTTGIEFRVAAGEKSWEFAADWLADPPAGAAQAGPWSVAEVVVQAPPVPTANGAQEGGVPGSPHEGTHDVKVHVRGRYDRLGDLVPRGFPAAVKVANPPAVAAGSGRKELADWLTRPDHPLTARVVVNRVWQFHLGDGLVRTPSNFGVLGEPPTHPELLDHLAAKFVRDGWSLKALHRYILLSAAYQQSAAGDPATRAADPDNKLWGRFPRRRLEAEAIRDSLLAVAGELDPKAGGPAVRDFNSPRRTVYLMTIRSDRTGFGPLFDMADSTAPVDKRTASTVAPQALFLMNHPFVRDRAKAFAARVMARDGTTADKLLFAHRLALGRPPTDAERELGLEVVKDGTPDAWRGWCHLLLQANEFVTVE